MISKKLLFIVNIPDFFISHRLSLALMAQKKGFQVHVATTDNENFHKLKTYGFISHKIYLNRGSLNVFHDLRTFISILRLLYKLRPDILHLLTSKSIIYGGLASRVIKIPKVVNAITGLGSVFVDTTSVFKNILKKIVLYLYKISINLNSITIFQNNDNLELFIKKRIINISQARLIYGSGVNTDVFFFSEESINNNPIVLFSSRLLKEKGLETFVDAAKIVKEKVNVRMVVVGEIDNDNPSSITSRQISKWVELGLIEWKGYIENMPKLLSESSIVCLPSYYPEGIPKALIEAASSGRPIVTTHMPGCNVIVKNNHNGILIPIKSPGYLADAILKLLDDPKLRSKYGKNGRRLVIENFSSDIIDKATIALYLR